MSRCLIDSDVIIWFLRGKKEAIELLNKAKRQGLPFCSPISVVEVLIGVMPGEKEITEDFLNSLGVIPIDREIAEMAGELAREQKNKTGRTGFSDAIIAATCLIGKFVLITYNQKHYRIFKDLEMYSE